MNRVAQLEARVGRLESLLPKSLAEARRWLEGRIGKRGVLAGEIMESARRNGISEAMLRQAKRELGVQSVRKGKQWKWTM